MFFKETFEEPRTKLNVEFDVNTLEELNLVIAHLENSRSLFMDKEGPLVNEMANKM